MSQTRLFDRSSREDWKNRGKAQSYAKALSRAVDILDENHKPEPLSESAVKCIRAIVNEAEKEMGVK